MTDLAKFLAANFILFAVLNWVLVIVRRRRNSQLLIPILGGASGAAFCLMTPGYFGYFWLPLLLDPGTSAIIFAVVASVAQVIRSRKVNKT